MTAAGSEKSGALTDSPAEEMMGEALRGRLAEEKMEEALKEIPAVVQKEKDRAVRCTGTR
jgi:hypothetical protein